MTDDQLRQISEEDLLRHPSIKVKIVRDRAEVAAEFARAMTNALLAGNSAGRNTAFIMPVGPTGQWRLFAEQANAAKLDLSRLHIFTMDEYVGTDGRNLSPDHPFSFARFVREEFLQVLQPARGFKREHLCSPDAQDLSRPVQAIEAAGGIDIAFAGIGLNGHMAFNEPPETIDGWSDESFAQSSVRVVKIAPTTKATNSIFGTGGDLPLVPTTR
jgi:glucosamine-6-phosphate deaminase